MNRIIEERGINQGIAAEEIGVTRPTVSDWCSAKKRPEGKNPAAIEEWSRDRNPRTSKLGKPRIPRDDWFVMVEVVQAQAAS